MCFLFWVAGDQREVYWFKYVSYKEGLKANKKFPGLHNYGVKELCYLIKMGQRETLKNIKTKYIWKFTTIYIQQLSMQDSDSHILFHTYINNID